MNNEKQFIPQMRPFFGELERAELMAYLEEDGFFTEFKRTELFENEIARFTGAKHCIVVNNGTVSLTLAAIAVGVVAGDEVIVPNYTMIATPNSIKLLGAKPVFVDVEPETLVMDVELVRRAITPRTKAIMIVLANGRAPKAGIKSFEMLSHETGIPLIEDAAQSLGSLYPDNRHIGRAGCFGSFSFSAPKIISTGQGGALITDDDELAGKVRKLKDFGRESGGNDKHDIIGYNFKFTELQACVGIAQMQQLLDRIAKKKEICNRYNNGLDGVDGVKAFYHDLSVCVPWFIDCLCEERDALKEFLAENGIGSREMYPPINKQGAYRLQQIHPVSEMVGMNGLWLPSMVQITDKQIDYVVSKIKEFYS